MSGLRCQITRWVADEPQPGLVEAHIVDSSGRVWIFVDKSPMFARQVIKASTSFPLTGSIPCKIVSREVGADGRGMIQVDTDYVESIEGAHRFEVGADQLTGNGPGDE